MKYIHEIWSHRALVGYITLVLLFVILIQLRQESTNSDIRAANYQACLALKGNVEAQRIALLALIRSGIAIAPRDPAVERELPYLRLALDSLDSPRCAR